MVYFSIDTETTGLDWEKCQLLEFGAIMEDTESPKTYDESKKFRAVFPHEYICGQPYALDMNKGIIEIIKDYQKIQDPLKTIEFMKKNDIVPMENFVGLFVEWLSSCGINPRKAINVAGKNFNGFDRRFLEKVSGWKDSVKVKHRVIDPAILFADWKKDDSMPSLDKCLERSGVSKKVSHNSLEDAWDVICVLRGQYVGK